MVVQDWLVTHLGWFYMAVVGVFFLFIIFLAFSRFAHIRLGPDDALADYSTSAGLPCCSAQASALACYSSESQSQ